MESQNHSLAVLLDKFSCMLESMARGEPCITVAKKGEIPKFVLREDEAEVALGLSAGSLNNRWDGNSPSYDPSFPPPILLGDGNERRVAIGWRTVDLARWVNTRPHATKKRQLNKRGKSLAGSKIPAYTEGAFRL